jgi:disulfide bond formation protein DsbB
MSPLAEIITRLLAVGTVVGNVLIIVFLIMLLLRSRRHENARLHNMLDVLETRALALAFTFSVVATVSSLFYSQIAGLPPCSLCWIQRILLFPQVLFLGLSWWFEAHKIVKYSAGLSVVGMAVSAYHSYLQYGGSNHIFCNALGGTVSCAQRYFLEFGYITMPIMSFTIFALLFILTFHFHRGRKSAP